MQGMTLAQHLAITNPCIEAEDTMNPLFKHRLDRWSIILSVNSGFE